MNPGSLPSTYANNNGNPPYNTNPNINTSATSAYVYKLNDATGDKTGLGVTLKVMTGDNVAIYGKSYWHGSSPNNSYTSAVNDLLTLLANSSAVAGAGKGATAGALTGSAVTPSELSTFLGTAPTVNGRPNSYINWILFDEQFRPVSSSSGFDPVNTSADVLKSHSQSVSISKNGYLYVYCSNESNQDVFFDNFQVLHTRGPLLEETHYYPFGLTMAGISSKAAGKLENRFKYNGIEHNTDLDLNQYDAFYRTLDPQLGRWWQIDPQADNTLHEFSPYSSMHNNPILASDFLGDFDDYQLKKDGEIELVKKTDDKTDKLYASDNKGNVNKSKSITVEKGILNNEKSGSLQIEGKAVEYNYLQVNGTGAKADKLFEFVANNSNVEWSIMKFEDGKSYINTSHSATSEAGAKGVLDSKVNKSSLKSHTHSHPGGITYPSGRPLEGYESESRAGDIPFSKSVERKYPNTPIGWSIYTPSNGQYSSYTSKDKQPPLQEVIIQSKRKKSKN